MVAIQKNLLYPLCIEDAERVEDPILFEILCTRAQNRACSSSAECSQDYLKTMQPRRARGDIEVRVARTPKGSGR